MGYYTDFTLSVRGYAAGSDPRNATDIPATMIEKLEAEINKMNVFQYGNIVDDYYADDKWYEWEADMSLLSKRFPEIFFCLHGEGENRDDMWNAYFYGGKSQICYATVTYEDFDPECLAGTMSGDDPDDAEYSYQSD